MRKHPFVTGAFAAVLAIAAAPAFASWSDNPAANLVIGNGSLGEQAQPKILPTSDGGCWISWFDDSTGGYSVRIQRLDSVGNKMLGPNGVLVATRYFSSTQDYSLSDDANGDALLAFRVSDSNQNNVKIEAQKVAPNGTLMWGANGVQFGNTADFLADPKITATSDGNVVVGWTDNADMDFAGLDGTGTQQWDTTISDPNGNELTLSDMHGSDSGSVIFSYVSSGGFSSPKLLYAQKLDTSGTSEWTTAVYDGGSLQFGNYPTFIPDGVGGAVFAWYDSTNLQSHAQHLASDGSEIFPHNGVIVATTSGDIQVEPSAAYDPETQDIFVFWTEEDAATQGNVGVSGQKIDAGGNLDWGASGITIVPKTTNADYLTSTVATSDDGTIVFYAGGTVFGQDQVYAARLDTNGSYVWNPGIVDVSSSPAQKFRLTSAITANDMAIATWEDIGTNSGNVLAQNVNSDGTLGATCPDGYTSYSGTLGPNATQRSWSYEAPAGEENAILMAPAGFKLYGRVDSANYGQWQQGFTGTEVHRWGPAGTYSWGVKANESGGAYTFCLNHA